MPSVHHIHPSNRLQTGEIAKSDDTKPLVEVGEEEAKKAEGESKEGAMEGAESTDAEVNIFSYRKLPQRNSLPRAHITHRSPSFSGQPTLIGLG